MQPSHWRQPDDLCHPSVSPYMCPWGQTHMQWNVLVLGVCENGHWDQVWSGGTCNLQITNVNEIYPELHCLKCNPHPSFRCRCANHLALTHWPLADPFQYQIRSRKIKPARVGVRIFESLCNLEVLWRCLRNIMVIGQFYARYRTLKALCDFIVRRRMRYWNGLSVHYPTSCQ